MEKKKNKKTPKKPNQKPHTHSSILHCLPELQTILLEMTWGKSQSRKDSQAWQHAFPLPDLGSLDIQYSAIPNLYPRTIMKPQTVAEEVWTK